MKVSPKIIRPFPIDRPRKARVKKQGKSRILTDAPEKTKIENQRAKKCKRKYSRKILEKTTVKKKLITVDSSEEDTSEIPYAEPNNDDYVEVSETELQILVK